MEEFKGNSKMEREQNKTLQTEKKVEKVVNGVVKTKKRGELHKFTDIFLANDIKDVKRYAFEDVIVPSIKKAIYDIITNGTDIMLYGEARHKNKNTNASKVSYGKFYERERERSDYAPKSKSIFDYEDLVFQARSDAEMVLDAMNDIIAQYGVVSVMDLYDLANVSTNNYTSNKYGWTDIRGCKAERVRDGYILRLPRPMPLN